MQRESGILARACLDLVESLSRRQRLKAKAKLEKPLEKAMQKAFRAQGKLLADGIRKLDRGLTEAVRDEDWEPVWERITKRTLDLFIGPIDKAARAALKAGGREAVSDTGGASIAFDLKSPKVVAFLKDRAADRVSMVNKTTKATIRSMITKGREANRSWSQIAMDLQDRFKEFAVGKPQAHVDSRAHLIAITEVGEAYSEGNLQGAQQLQAAGIVQEKFWDSIGDDKVSDGCRTNEAAGWIDLDDDFPSGHQRPLRFPGCRCDLLTRRKKA